MDLVALLIQIISGDRWIDQELDGQVGFRLSWRVSRTVYRRK
jgi:hypothetical protein